MSITSLLSCLFPPPVLYCTYRRCSAEYTKKEKLYMSEEKINKFSIIDMPDFPPSIDNALQNLTDKPTKNAGETFGDIWYLVFGGLSHIADKRRMKYAAELEKLKTEISDTMSHIPNENKFEPSVQITAQALENSKYCVEEPALRNMFASLISKSMDNRYTNDVHPAFAEMIKQMSPLDGQILKKLAYASVNGLPICNFKKKINNGGTYQIIAEKVFLEIASDDTEKISLSISSLERLGLVCIPPFQYFTNKALYDKFRQHPIYRENQKVYGDVIMIENGILMLTPLGKSFVRVCILD